MPAFADSRRLADPSRRLSTRRLFSAALAAGVTLFFALASFASADPASDGVKAHGRKDYSTAMRILRPLADQGSPIAQFYVGVMYEWGQGVPQNGDEAAKWFRKAAEQGHAVSQASLGLMYFAGNGVARSYAEAARWWLRAAKQGDASAQVGLGTIYKEGYGVPQNYILAYMWFTVSAHDPDYRRVAQHDLDAIAQHLAPSQIAEADKLARRCVETAYADCNQAPQSVAGVDERAPISNAQNSSPFVRIPLKMNGSLFVVPVELNGAITQDFAIDSGATDVSVPASVFSALKRAGTVSESDLIGQRTYLLADGSKSQSSTFILKSLKVGEIAVENVRASLSPSQGMLLLGQSFLRQFKSWAIDNANHELVLEPR